MCIVSNWVFVVLVSAVIFCECLLFDVEFYGVGCLEFELSLFLLFRAGVLFCCLLGSEVLVYRLLGI